MLRWIDGRGLVREVCQLEKVSSLSAGTTLDSDEETVVHSQISECRVTSGGVFGWLCCWFVQDALISGSLPFPFRAMLILKMHPVLDFKLAFISCPDVDRCVQ